MFAFAGIFIGLAMMGAGIAFAEQIGTLSSILLVASGALIILIKEIGE